MEILKGMVKDPGFPDEECTYAKVDENTLYYFIKNYSLPNGNIIATTNLKEAIGHAPATSLGLINPNGDVLIPFENKTIKLIENEMLLVEKNVPTSESVVNAFNQKSDPFSAQTLADAAATIKNQMSDIMGMNGDFIFDNQFSEAALFTLDGVNIANGYFSFIGENNGDYYLATNVAGATIMKFNPSQLKQPQEPEPQHEEPQPEVSLPEVNNDSNTAEMSDLQESNSDIVNINNIDQAPESEKVQQPQQAESSGELESTPTQEDTTEQTIEDSTDTDLLEENIPDQEIDTSENELEDQEIKLNIDSASKQEEEENTSLEEQLPDDNASEIESTELNESEENTEQFNEVNDDFPNYSEVSNDEKNDYVDAQPPYNLTDEDIATPTIKDATNTIKKLLEENRKQRQIIDKQMGEIEALKSNSLILNEENDSKEKELQSLRLELSNYRTQAINLSSENTKLKSTLTRQSDIMRNLEEQNTALRDQVGGLHALSNVVAEANVLVQPVSDSLDINNNQSTNLDIDSYLNGKYNSNNNTYGNFGYLDSNDNDKINSKKIAA